jgi:hypothetical protein
MDDLDMSLDDKPKETSEALSDFTSEEDHSKPSIWTQDDTDATAHEPVATETTREETAATTEDDEEELEKPSFLRRLRGRKKSNDTDPTGEK